MSFKGTEPEEDFDFSYKSVPPKRTVHIVMMSQEKAKALREVVEAARALISAMTGDKRYRDDLLEERCFEALRDSLNAFEEESR